MLDKQLVDGFKKNFTDILEMPFGELIMLGADPNPDLVGAYVTGIYGLLEKMPANSIYATLTSVLLNRMLTDGLITKEQLLSGIEAFTRSAGERMEQICMCPKCVQERRGRN